MQERNARPPASGSKIFSWVVIGLLLLVMPLIIGIVAVSVLSSVFSATGSFFAEVVECGDGGCRTPTPIVINSINATPTPPPGLFVAGEIGTELTYDGKQLLVTSVTQAASYGKVTADAGYQLVAVNLTFTDLTVTTLDMSTSNFDVIDNAGHIYTRIKNAKTPALSSQPASSPPSATGWLTFQVPEKASNLILQYHFASNSATPTILQIYLGDLVSQKITVIPTAPRA